MSLTMAKSETHHEIFLLEDGNNPVGFEVSFAKESQVFLNASSHARRTNERNS